jgi:hypothetical protein
MASTYTPDEIKDSGILLKQNLSSNTTYTIEITDKAITGSAYFFLETRTYDNSLPVYFDGATISGSFVGGGVEDGYKIGINIFPEGASEIKLTTGTEEVRGENVYIKATGNIGAVITP